MRLKIFAGFAALHFLIAVLNFKIGFDYDDTISFSTPAFDKGFEAEINGVQPLSPEFWSIVNRNWALERPKWGVISWAVLFKVLGFDIVIITVRTPVGTEPLIAKWSWLHDGFYFTKDKATLLKARGFVAFIGDSDSDMEECVKAGVTAVRARRSPNSSYKENYSPGKYNEWILPFSG